MIAALLSSPALRRAAFLALAAAAALAVWAYIAHLQRSVVEAQAATLIAEGKAVAAESLLILKDHQHRAVMAGVAKERLAADQRERELHDARARMERVPVDKACSTPAVVDEALDIIGGSR